MTTATAPVTNEHQDISDVMKQFGRPGSVPDMTETIRQVESVKTVRFAFHSWYPLANFGSDGFRFNVPYPVLGRLDLIPLAVFQYPKIIARGNGQFALMGATLAEAVPAMGSQSKVETHMQMPSVSMRDLHTAWGKYGMTELASLAAQDEKDLADSFILFHAVMGPAQDDDDLKVGRRPEKLLLEDFPGWLASDAPRALRAGLNGVIVRGKPYRITKEQIRTGEKLIEEIKQSIARAEAAALNDSDGILPTTRKLLNVTANKGQGGKTSLDNLDRFLLEQYPSFEMDTDVERAQKAMQSALEAGNQGSNEINTGILALMQQNQEMLRQQQETVSLLAREVIEAKRAREQEKKALTRKPADQP